MKIFSAKQIHDWDAYTIEHEPIASIDLMVRAAMACTDWITEHSLQQHQIKIFCGKGNNGGDGLAIARQLINIGAEPLVYILEFGAKGTDDFQSNLATLHQLTKNIFFIQSKEFFPLLNKGDVLIDALFGSGLNRPLEGLSAELIQHINEAYTKVIAVDIPSGLYLDKSSKGNTVIEAAHTLTFQSLKLCCLMAENTKWLGELHVLPIGLNDDYESETATNLELITAKQIAEIYKPRKPFSHKGTYGHALLIAGSKGKMGATVMAAKSCLRSGVGLLTCILPEEERGIMQTSVHEAMIYTEEKIDYTKFTTVGIGPGIGTKDDGVKKVEELLHEFKKPLVIDADALNIIADNKELLNKIPEGSIITPHPKEFDRLFGESANDFERMSKALELSKQYQFVIVLKGHYTLTAYKGKGIYNTTGNSGMATGGTGDTLTGILTSLLAQHYSPIDAALLGVYLHGLCADVALETQSEESLLPTDMTEHLGKAFKIIVEIKYK